jgi:hypothetical protein
MLRGLENERTRDIISQTFQVAEKLLNFTFRLDVLFGGRYLSKRIRVDDDLQKGDIIVTGIVCFVDVEFLIRGPTEVNLEQSS